MNSTTVDEAVDSLLRSGVNFVAIDFDCTLIAQHTGGRWRGETKDLVDGVREVFRQLVPRVMDKDICVAIVTFSPQADLIKDVLREAFPSHCSRIVVRARDNSWGFMGAMKSDGKQKNMASAAEELSTLNPSREITRGSTLLIDDDVNNIKIALQHGVRAVYFNPDLPEKLVDDLKELVTQHQSSLSG